VSVGFLLLDSAPGRLVEDLLSSVFLICAAPVLGDLENFVVVLLAVVTHGLTPTWLKFCHSGSEADHNFTPSGPWVFLELPELPVAVFHC
jgi:hypothetical protein